METVVSMHTHKHYAEMMCAQCAGAFLQKKPWQSFCSSQCRNDYAVQFGRCGKVRGVRKVKDGVSITVHFQGPAGEAALKLALHQPVTLVPRRQDQSGPSE